LAQDSAARAPSKLQKPAIAVTLVLFQARPASWCFDASRGCKRCETYECKPGLPSLWLDPALSAAPALIVLTSGLRHSFFVIGDSVPLTQARRLVSLVGSAAKREKGQIR
jgi:hypothetical protein